MGFKEALIQEIGTVHNGKNYVLDKGVPFSIYESYLHSLGEYIHVVKLGWTTWALFDEKELRKKIDLASELGIEVCLGGTLFEIAASENYYEQLLDYIVEMNIKNIEIASGFALEFDELKPYIEKATQKGLNIFVEIGRKNEEEDNAISPVKRLEQIKGALSCGANKVILEARESGAGYSVFKSDVDANDTFIELLKKEIPLSNVIFEAPLRANQIFLVKEFGPDVQLANLPYDEIPRVETIRRSLHANTYKHS